MKPVKLLSWNVNGLRAIYRKGFLDWFRKQNADIICVQETKATEEQLPVDLVEIPGYHSYFTSAERKGYSGVALWSKEKPKRVSTDMGIKRFDAEGRMIRADYPGFVLLDVYFPNGGASHERLMYKLDFYDSLLDYIARLKRRKLIICGDFNTAHEEIDLARPKQNQTISGFLPQEREWIDKLIARGMLDTFRLFNREGGNYTWWDYQTRARERNVGWRIDYFFISKSLKKTVKSAFIQPEVMGSDHCPVGIELSL
jgi:exodeoxyribonuclease-3